MKQTNVFLITTSLFALAACGGGGGGGTSAAGTAVGYFKDASVSGLTYVSGDQSGVTGADGRFTYTVGSTVTFSLGGVTVGTVQGAEVVTPVDLVAGANTSTPAVQNIVRFLMMLDQDQNPDNGIQISAGVQTAAANWTNVDFGSSTFDSDADVLAVVSDVASVDGNGAALPTGSTAQQHVENTIRCAYSGGFKGTFSGGASGTFGLIVEAGSGQIDGVAYNPAYDELIPLAGQGGFSLDSTRSFVSGSLTSGGAFDGHFTSVNAIAGSWQAGTASGSFSGSRVGGSQSAAYRFTGHFGTNNSGLITFDIDNTDRISGKGYDTTMDNEFDFSGSVSGSTFTATTSDGVNVSGNIDLASYTFSGQWTNGVDSGSLSGTGCKLN